VTEAQADASGEEGETDTGPKAEEQRAPHEAEGAPEPSGGGSLRERIHVYSGGGDRRDEPGVRVNEPPRPEPEGNPTFPPAAYAALEAYRDPEALAAWLDPKCPLPEGMHELLRIAVGKDEGYGEAAWVSLGCDRKELQDAARHFVAKVLFVEGADYFRNLALGPDARDEQIKAHYRLLFRIFQPVDGASDPNWSRRQVKALNRAYNTLRNSERRAAYLQRLRQQGEPREAAPEWSPVPPGEGDREGGARSAVASGEVAEPPPPERDTASGGHGWIWAGTAIALLLLAGGLYWSLGLQEGEREAGVSSAPVPTTQIPVRREAAMGEQVSGGEIEALPGTPSTRSVERAATDTGHSEGSSAPRSESHGVASSSSAVTPARSTPPPAGDGVRGEASRREAASPRSVPAGRPEAAPKPPAAPQRQDRLETPVPPRSEGKKDREQAKAPSRPAPEPKAVAKAPEKASPPASPAAQVAEVRKPSPASARSAETTAPATAERAARVDEAPVIALSLPVLQKLMKDFFNAYARGDIEAFMGYFAPTAFTNDQTDLAGIRRDYQQLFEATEERRMQADLSWELIDDDRARGEGRFMVSVRPKGARQARIVTGSLVVQVVVGEDGRPLIGGLFHTYDRPR